jgi:hypothetical protein
MINLAKKSHKTIADTLVDDVNTSYFAMKKLDNTDTRFAFYNKIIKLYKFILNDALHKQKTISALEDCKDLLASDFAIRLLELIDSKGFEIIEDLDNSLKFSWYNYVKLNVRTKLKIHKSRIKVEQIFHELLTQDNNTNDMIIRELSEKVRNQLLLFYSEQEIQQLLNISSAYLTFNDFRSNIYNIYRKTEFKIYRFCVLLYCLAHRALINNTRRIKEPPIDELHSAIKKAVTSTLFLASVANTDKFPLPLFAALDMESFKRLIKVAGGQTITIPTQKELDELLGHICAMEKIITENKNKKLAYKLIAKEYQLDYLKDLSETDFVEKVFSFLKEEKSLYDPIFKSIIESIQLVNKLIKSIDIKKLNLSDNVAMQYYVSLNTLLNTSLLSLINLKNKE